MKFTKRTAEVYLFEDLPHHVWAKFTVDDMEHKGRISIASDYGDWQNGWGGCGVPFKQFLCDIGIDYAADKFGADKWFDHDKTITRYRRDILENRRSHYIEKEIAKAMWDEVASLEGESMESHFTMMIVGCDAVMKYYNYMPDLSYGIHPLFRRFWNECWSLFVAELKREISVLEPA